MPAFDAKSFRRALGNFATGVTIVTAQNAQGQKVGVTANSFNSVSLEPALVLWSLDKRSGSYPVFDQASHFAVNILAADQITLSNHFARPKEDKFVDIAHREGIGGALLLEDCAAHFQCKLYQQIDAGDHFILIGEVLDFKDTGRAPLVYHQGTYATVFPHPSLNTPSQSTDGTNSSVPSPLSGNMNYLLTQAVRAYQSSYQPKQLACGLRTSEARLLLVLEAGRIHSQADLLREVNMPQDEIEQAITMLTRKELIQQLEGGWQLSTAGHAQVKRLHDIAEQHQQQVFGQYSVQEVDAFKQMLQRLIDMSV